MLERRASRRFQLSDQIVIGVIEFGEGEPGKSFRVEMLLVLQQTNRDRFAEQ